MKRLRDDVFGTSSQFKRPFGSSRGDSWVSFSIRSWVEFVWFVLSSVWFARKKCFVCEGRYVFVFLVVVLLVWMMGFCWNYLSGVFVREERFGFSFCTVVWILNHAPVGWYCNGFCLFLVIGCYFLGKFCERVFEVNWEKQKLGICSFGD